MSRVKILNITSVICFVVSMILFYFLYSNYETVESNQTLKFLNPLFFSIAIVITIFWVIGLCFVLRSSNNESRISNSFFSLSDWVKKNNIGSATSIIRSLSSDEDVEAFFKEKQQKINNDLKKRKKKNYLTNKDIYLISEMKSIVDAIDSVTKENLAILKTFTEFESAKDQLWDKVITGLISLGGIGLLGAATKYGLDCYYSIDKHIAGIWILRGVFIVFVLSVIGWTRAYFITVKEKNSRNFLNMIFKILEEDEKNKDELSKFE